MSWFVNYVTMEREDRLVVFPNFPKLLLWFLLEARACRDIHIFIA